MDGEKKQDERASDRLEPAEQGGGRVPSGKVKEEITGVIPKDQITDLLSSMRQDTLEEEKTEPVPQLLLDESIDQDVPTWKEAYPEEWEISGPITAPDEVIETQSSIVTLIHREIDEQMRARWSEAVAGILAEASHTRSESNRARLLTVAAGLTWQLLSDHERAEQLLELAIQTDAGLFSAQRERALMRLRLGKDVSWALKAMVDGLEGTEGYDIHKKLRGRALLYCSAAALSGESSQTPAADRLLSSLPRPALEALRGSSLAPMWMAFQARAVDLEEFSALYLAAIRQTHIPTLKAALLVDLATGLWCQRYLPAPGREVKPAHLMREVVNLVPNHRLYEALLMLVAAGKLEDQHDILQGRIEMGAPEPVHLRAAAVAEALGQFGLASRSLQKIQPPGPSPVADWKLFRLAITAGRFEQAGQVIHRLRLRAAGELEAAMLALEEASLAALMKKEPDVFACCRDAVSRVSDLEIARSQVGSFFLRQGAYRELMDLRASDLIAMASTHARRGEILETRLNSPAEAAAEYRLALARDPAGRTEALRSLERLFTYNREYDALHDLYLSQIDQEPTLKGKCALLRQAAELDRFERRADQEAVLHYTRLIDLAGEDLEAMRTLVEIHLRRGEAAVALPRLEALLDRLPPGDLHRLLLTDWLYHLPEDTSGTRVAQAARSLATSSAAWDLFERCCLRTGDHVGLVEGLADPAAPSGRETQLLLAWACCRMGRYEEAIQAVEPVAVDHPDDPSARDLLVYALHKSGRKEQLNALLRGRQGERSPSRPLTTAWGAWWKNPCSAEAVRLFSEQVQTTPDVRIARVAWLAGSASGPDRLKAARSLLACEPTDLRLQAIAEGVAISHQADEERLDLYLSWARDSTTLDRDYLIHQIARCYHRMKRHQDALSLWEKLAVLQPGFVPARLGQIACLTALGQQQQADERIAELDEHLLDCLHGSPQTRATALESLVQQAEESLRPLLLLELSELVQHLGQPAEALARAIAAYRDAPQFRSAIRQIIRLGNSPSLDQVVPEELKTDAELCAAVLTLTDQTDRALGVLIGTLAVLPDPEAIGGLIAAGQQLKDPEFLLDALTAWSALSTHPDLLDEIDRQAAELAEFVCDDPDSAAEAYRRAWKRRPNEDWLALHLARCTAREQVDPEKRGEVIEELQEHPSGLSGLWLLLMERELPEASDLLQQVSRRAPHYLPIEWALLSDPGLLLPPDLLAHRGRRRSCALALIQAADGFARSGEASVAESLCYEALSFSSDEDMGAFGGPHHFLSRHLEDQDRAVEVLAIGEDLIGRAHSGPVKRRLLEGAVLLSLLTGKSGTVARKAMMELVTLDPTDPFLLRRALARMVEVGEWEEVCHLIRLEMDLQREGSPELLPLLWWELGEIHRRHLDDPQAALAAYRQGATTGRPSFFLSTAIARLLVETDELTELVDHYQQALEAEEQPAKIARLHINIGGIYEFQLLNGRKAFSHYKEALARDPGNLSALVSVVRLAERSGLPSEGLEAMQALADQLSGPLQHALLLRAAEVAELRLVDYRLAEQLYHRLEDLGVGELAQPGLDSCLLAQVKPQDLPARMWSGDRSRQSGIDFTSAMLTMIRPQVESRWEAQADAPACVWATRIFRNGPGGDANLIRQAAMALAEQVGDATGAADVLRFGQLIGAAAGLVEHLTLLRRLIELDPSDELALLLLEAQVQAGSDAERQVIDARLRVAPEGVVRSDALIALVRHLALCQQQEELFVALEKLLDATPDLPISQYFRAALSAGGDDPALQVEQLEADARRATSPTSSAELLLQAARIRRRQLGQIERAVINLRQVIAQDPGQPEAFDELREILLTLGDSQGLYELFLKRYQVTNEATERISLLTRMAELAFVKLQDRDKAVWCHQEIVRWDPSNIRSFRILAEIYLEQEQFAKAAEMLEEVAVRAHQPSLVIRTHTELAQLYRENLQLPEKAADSFRAILALKPDHQEALVGLADHAEHQGNWEEAATCLQQLAQLASSRDQAADYHIRLSEVLAHGGLQAHRQERERALCRAVELAPQDPRAIQNLVAYLEGCQEPELLEAVSQQILGAVQLSDQTPDERIALKLLFDLHDTLGNTHRAFVAAGVLAYLGYETERSQQVHRQRPRQLQFWRSLSPLPPEQTGSIFHRQTRIALVNLLRVIDPPLNRVFPSRAKLLGASRKARIKGPSHHPAIRVGQMLGQQELEIYACLAPGSRPQVEPGSPAPVLLIASDFDLEACSEETVWILANTLAPWAMGFSSLGRVPPKRWTELVAFAVRKVNPQWLQPVVPSIIEPELLAALEEAIPKKTVDQLTEHVKALESLDHPQLQMQYRLLQIACASLAAVACPDPLVALQAADHSGLGTIGARGMIPFLLGRTFGELQRSAGLEVEQAGP